MRTCLGESSTPEYCIVHRFGYNLWTNPLAPPGLTDEIQGNVSAAPPACLEGNIDGRNPNFPLFTPVRSALGDAYSFRTRDPNFWMIDSDGLKPGVRLQSPSPAISNM